MSSVCFKCQNFFLGFCEVHLEDVPREAWENVHNCPDYRLESEGLAIIKEWLAAEDSQEVRNFLDVFEGKIEIPEEIRQQIWSQLGPKKRKVMARFFSLENGEF